MSLTLEEWHARFIEQSNWTAALRAFLFSQVELTTAKNVLEVGCGTGAILHSVSGKPGPNFCGIDIELNRTEFAQHYDPHSAYSCADGLNLPFAAAAFDITFCHYYLLWLPGQALQALREMERVTRPGGTILALAEPAHSRRIDYPLDFSEMGKLQTASLVKQGIDPDMGLRLPELFSQANLSEIQYGQSGFQNQVGQLPGWFESEWKTLHSDLDGTLSPTCLQQLQDLERQDWLDGTRVLQIPTFYAFGKVDQPS